MVTKEGRIQQNGTIGKYKGHTQIPFGFKEIKISIHFLDEISSEEKSNSSFNTH